MLDSPRKRDDAMIGDAWGNLHVFSWDVLLYVTLGRDPKQRYKPNVWLDRS